MKPAGAILALAILALAAPALAQQAPGASPADASIMCVYDGLSDWAVKQLAYESLGRKPEDPAKLKSEVDGVAGICASTHKWDAKHKTAALLMTKYGVIVGTLGAELKVAGFDDSGALLAVLDGLPNEDYAKLVNESWRTDKPLQARMRSALIARGVPDKPELVEKAMTIMANYALSDVVTASWNKP